MFYCYYRKCITGIILIMLLLLKCSYAINPDTLKRNIGTLGNLIKGQVLDNDGIPLPDALVKLKGSSGSVKSDAGGEFRINVSPGTILEVSHTGFYPREVQIKETETIIVRLDQRYLQSPDSVNVLYDEVSKNNMIGSVTSVYTDQLSTTPATLYAYALPGRLAGLYTEQISGFRNPPISQNANHDILGNIPVSGATGPNDNTEIGLSLRGQTPVTIVDGVQRDIFSLDPENIESISVLKDPLSTIFLGQRSSRGILLVTTKKAKQGKPRLSFTAQTALQEPLKLPKPLSSSQYAYLLNEALQNDGGSATYDADDFYAYANGTDPFGHPDVNWYNTILKDSSPLTRYNLSVNGGGSKARYYVSLNYLNQDGLFKTSPQNSYNTNVSLNRYLINTNIDIDVTKNFNVAMQLFGRLQQGYQPGAKTNTIMDRLISTPNSAYPIYNPDGSWGGSNHFNNGNLLALVTNSGYVQDNSKDVMVNVDLGYNFGDWIKGLSAKAKANLSIQSSNAIDRSKQAPTYEFGINDAGDTVYTPRAASVTQVNTFLPVSNAQYWFAQLALNYDRTFGKHGVSLMVLGDRRQTMFNYDLPGLATNLSGKASYDYADKYFVQGALNYSGYDRYPPGHQYGLFYAFGAGWDVAKENYIRDNFSWLNQFKFRGTYGKTGNGVDNSGYYIWRQVYAQEWGIGAGIYPQGTGRSQGNGFSESQLANVNITWEKAHKLDLGLDVSVIDNHLQFSADYYHDRYYDLLQQRGKTIALIGVSYPFENIGTNLYQGGELSVTYQSRIKNFNYFVTANGNAIKSKVIFSDEQRREYDWSVRTSKPVLARFGYIADGLFQTAEEAEGSATIAGYTSQPGDIKYKDLNQDGVIDQFDQTFIGTNKPLIYYGFTIGCSYKGIEFSTLLQGVYNRQIYVDNVWTEAGYYIAGNLGFGQAYQQILNRWTPETAATATYPRLTADPNNYINRQTSSFWVRSGDYFRLKNINLAYNLPYKLTQRLRLAGVKVFVNAQNVFTHAKYGWRDPEVGPGSYPIQRVFNTGINVKL